MTGADRVRSFLNSQSYRSLLWSLKVGALVIPIVSPVGGSLSQGPRHRHSVRASRTGGLLSTRVRTGTLHVVPLVVWYNLSLRRVVNVSRLSTGNP